MAIPQGWGALGFTSGRRTYRGNKLVGGVPHSNHLDGTAADFTAPLDVLRARFPGHPILNEGDHRHVGGLSDVPYFGHQGIAGLVNGVDTTAPQGQPPMARIQPRKPVQSLYPQANGIDPLAPQMAQAPQYYPQQQPMPQPPQVGESLYPQQANGVDPLAPKKNHTGKTLGAIAGILGDAMAAYGGQRGVYAPFMQQQAQNDAEENRFQQQLAAQIQARKEAAALKAAEPPQEFQTADYYNHLDPERQAAFRSARDAISPIVADIAQPDGSVRRSIIPRGDMSGSAPKPGTVEDGYEYIGGDPANPQSWRRR